MMKDHLNGRGSPELRFIFNSWLDANRAANSHPDGEGAEYEAAVERVEACCRLAVGYPEKHPDDWAIKILIADTLGEMSSNNVQVALVVRALDTLGLRKTVLEYAAQARWQDSGLAPL